jgi:hypothetical protein
MKCNRNKYIYLTKGGLQEQKRAAGRGQLPATQNQIYTILSKVTRVSLVLAWGKIDKQKGGGELTLIGQWPFPFLSAYQCCVL